MQKVPMLLNRFIGKVAEGKNACTIQSNLFLCNLKTFLFRGQGAKTLFVLRSVVTAFHNILSSANLFQNLESTIYICF